MTAHEVAGPYTGIGVWEPTGERTAEIGYFFQDIDPYSPNFDPGTVLLRATVEVDEDGGAATVTYGAEA